MDELLNTYQQAECLRLSVWQALGLPAAVSQIIDARGQYWGYQDGELSLSDGGAYRILWCGHYKDRHTVWLASVDDWLVSVDDGLIGVDYGRLIAIVVDGWRELH